VVDLGKRLSVFDLIDFRDLRAAVEAAGVEAAKEGLHNSESRNRGGEGSGKNKKEDNSEVTKAVELSNPGRRKVINPWTREEDERLWDLQKKFGNQWLKFVNEGYFPGRTEVEVNTRFHHSIKKSQCKTFEDFAAGRRYQITKYETKEYETPYVKGASKEKDCSKKNRRNEKQQAKEKEEKQLLPKLRAEEANVAARKTHPRLMQCLTDRTQTDRTQTHATTRLPPKVSSKVASKVASKVEKTIEVTEENEEKNEENDNQGASVSELLEEAKPRANSEEEDKNVSALAQPAAASTKIEEVEGPERGLTELVEGPATDFVLHQEVEFLSDSLGEWLQHRDKEGKEKIKVLEVKIKKRKDGTTVTQYRLSIKPNSFITRLRIEPDPSSPGEFITKERIRSARSG
jgi:hypothetical protein